MGGSVTIWSSNSLGATWASERLRYYPTPLSNLYCDAPWCVVRQMPLLPSLFVAECWQAFLDNPLRNQRERYVTAALDRVAYHCDRKMSFREIRYRLSPTILVLYSTLGKIYDDLTSRQVGVNEVSIQVEAEYICVDFLKFVEAFPHLPEVTSESKNTHL